MATTIPFDPSLALGNLVPAGKLEVLEQIAQAQSPVDSSQEELDSAIMMLRSLEMTLSEMANMRINTEELSKNLDEAQKAVADAAGKLVTARLAALPKVTALRSRLSAISDSIESPIDYNRSQIKRMPLSADSLTMDTQYFSFDENEQESNNAMMAIKSYVSSATKVLGVKRSAEATTAVNTQISKQRQHHEIQGTLIITATCTHKDAVLLAPLFLDVDKAIRVWNTVFPKEMIKTNDPKSMATIAAAQQTPKESQLQILSGATYGSSFIGMVHILRSEDTTANQTMVSAASSLQAQLEAGSWFAHMEGGFGINSSFANDAKKMLSTQQISSHVSLVTVGAIPSIKSNEVQLGVKQFAKFDPAEMMGQLATLANATTAAQSSVKEGAQAARTGNQMVQIRGNDITSVMSGLEQVDDGKNKMLDVNSLMTAFEDYVDKVLAGNAGAPITYYLKPITASQLAQMWVAKYLPGQYVTSSGDDSEPAPQPTPSPAT